MPDELLRIRDGAVPLAEAWRALRNGSFIVVEGHSTDTEHALSLEPRTSGEPPHGEDLSILEDYFRRGSQSALAIERRVSCSSIALHARAAIQAIGLSRATRPPVLLVWAYLAANATSPVCVSATANAERIQLRYPRLDSLLTDVLTAKDAAIISLYIQGHDVHEIASVRGTRARGIATRCNAAFRTLKVSSRLQLLALLGNKALGLDRNA